MPEEVKENNAIGWKYIQVIGLAAPVVGYTLAYVHEVAFFDWFHVPTEFITLTWDTIIVSAVASVAGAYLLILPFLMLSLTKYSKNH
jgi:hypothetical protein